MLPGAFNLTRSFLSPCNVAVRQFVQRAFIFAVALGILGAGFWFLGRPAYRKHKEARSLEQAKRYLAKGDYPNASLSARQALLLNPSNLDACRVMAELCQIARAPQLLDWRRKIAEISPTLENKVLLASAASRTQGPPYPLAAETLERLKADGQDYAPYHVVSAELALKTKRPDAAAEHFAQAARLEPDNPQHRLNLSVLHLQSTNRTEAAEARAALENLGRSTNLGVVALRWLVADRIDNKDWPAAEAYSSQLIAQSASNLEDRLLHLGILRSGQKPDFDPFLQGLQKQALTNAAGVYAVSAWMISQGLVDQAIQWLTNAPAKIQSEQPVPLALVDCYLARKDWKRLQSFLEGGSWGDQEFLRLAFLSRATAELKDSLGADGLWRAAVRSAGDRLGALSSLLSMATSWEKAEAREALLWQIAQKFPKERWAYRELDRTYQAAKNTRGLNKVYAAMMSSEPSNLQVKNNFATTSFLLKQGLPAAHDVAKEIYQQDPGDPIICSTYAYSLHLQGRNKEAAAVVSNLSAKDQENPALAVYLAAIFLRNGQTNQACHCLALARENDLLAEEKTLAETIRKAM